jgi:hypothetical protein
MTSKNGSRVGDVHWGAIFVLALGFVLLLGNFNLLPSDLWNYWPVLLIIAGVSMLFKKR